MSAQAVKAQSQDEKDFAEYQEYQQFLAAQGGSEEPAAEEGMGAFGKTLHGLDFQRAATTGPMVAAALEKLSGKQVIRPGEYEGSLKFKNPYPGTGEMLERAGYLTESPITRSLLGMGADIATDPATYESAGVSALAKLKNLGRLKPLVRGANMVLNPMEEFMRYRGAKNYANAFKKVDEVAAERGKKLIPSQVMQDEGFVGSMGGAAKKTKAMNKEAGNEIGAVLDDAANQGAAVDTFDLVKKGWSKIQELRSLGLEKSNQIADDIERQLVDIWKGGQDIPVDKANQMKSFLDKQIKESGFAAGGEASLKKQAEMEVAGALRDQIPRAVSATDPSLGLRLGDANRKFAVTDKKMVKKIAQFARQEGNPFALSRVDLMLAGLGGGSAYLGDENPLGGAAGALLLKKGGRIGMSTLGRTARGKVATTIAREGRGLVDPAVRQAPKSVWEAMEGEEE